MGLKRTYTQGAMEKAVLFHAPAPLVDALRLAATHEEVTRSHFIRQAIKEKICRVLGGIDVAPAESANAGRGPAAILADESGSVVGIRGTAKKQRGRPSE